jgi:hypothetical protein
MVYHVYVSQSLPELRPWFGSTRHMNGFFFFLEEARAVFSSMY